MFTQVRGRGLHPISPGSVGFESPQWATVGRHTSQLGTLRGALRPQPEHLPQGRLAPGQELIPGLHAGLRVLGGDHVIEDGAPGAEWVGWNKTTVAGGTVPTTTDTVRSAVAAKYNLIQLEANASPTCICVAPFWIRWGPSERPDKCHSYFWVA